MKKGVLMSKRTKIIMGLIAVVALIGLGVFNYLYSTGRIKLKAVVTSPSPSQPTISALSSQVLMTYNSTAYAKYAKDRNWPAYGFINKMWVKNISGGRGVSGNTLLVYPGDKIQIGVQVVDFIKDGDNNRTPNGLSGAGVYNAPEDPGNTNFTKYTNWQHATINYSTTPQDCTSGGQSSGWTDNIPYGNYSNPSDHGYGGYLWSVPKNQFLRPDWCPKNVTLNVNVNNNAPANATFKTGWAFGWCNTYKGENNGQLYAYQWSGDGFYNWFSIKVIPRPPTPSPKISSIKPFDYCRQSTGTKSITVFGSDFGTDISKCHIRIGPSGGSLSDYPINSSSSSLKLTPQALTTDSFPANADVGEYSVQVVVDGSGSSNTVTFNMKDCPTPNSNIKGIKSAYNQTQKKTIDKGVISMSGDSIKYTLNTWNEGDKDEPQYIIQDDISDILNHTIMKDTGGGSVVNNSIVYPATDIKSGSSSQSNNVVKEFTVQVKPSDQWPASDLTMSNVYQGSSVSAVLGFNNVSAVSKVAFNETQKVDATTTNANPGDEIRYTLEAENKGNLDMNNFLMNEDISSILEYADVVDTGGGTVVDNNINWLVSVEADSRTARVFKVKIKSSDQWPSLGDLTLSNTYGPSTVNIKLEPQSVLGAITAPVSGVLTATGTKILLVILVALLIVLIYFVIRALINRRKK